MSILNDGRQKEIVPLLHTAGLFLSADLDFKSSFYLFKSWDLVALDSSIQDERRAEAEDISQ